MRKQRLLDIDFVKYPLYANILDWSFHGDPKEPLVLNVQTKTVNNDGSITLSEIKSFRFNSSPVVDTVFNQSSSRTSLEIPGFFFNKNNAVMTLNSGFNMRDIFGNSVRIRYLHPLLIAAAVLYVGAPLGVHFAGDVKKRIEINKLQGKPAWGFENI